MDIQRKRSVIHSRRFRVIVISSFGIAAVSLGALGLSRLKPAALGVERAALVIDSVKRGPMVREVRGPGNLIAEDVRIIAAATAGRVERVLVHPGTPVIAGTVLVQLSNPELEQSAVDAEYQLRAAEADYKNLKVRLESDRMTQRAGAATVHAEYEEAKLQTDTDEALAKEGLVPQLSLKLSRVKTEELANRNTIEEQRLDITSRSASAQLDSQQARNSQLQAVLKLKREQVQNMRVLAGTTGVLQQMQVEEGQQVAPGTNLARVVEPQHLKAELKIAETQVKDVRLGQSAEIDTRNGLIPGHVSRIDPAALQGTVTVDVALDGQLPQSARPDLNIDGTIELERLSDVIFMGHPASGQEHSTVGIFKLETGGNAAVRVQVKLGRTSVSAVEVIEGLQPGDQVILSDTSQWDAYSRIQLK